MILKVTLKDLDFLSLSWQLWNQICSVDKARFSFQLGGLNLEPRNQAVFFLVLTMSLRVNYHQDATPAHIRDPGKQPPASHHQYERPRLL